MDDHSIPLFSKSQFNINWAQLTSLTFFQISPPLPSALDIIREAVNLVEFHYMRPLGPFVGFGEKGPNLSPLIVHHNLQIVRLGLEESNDLGFFVEKLTLLLLKSFKNYSSPDHPSRCESYHYLTDGYPIPPSTFHLMSDGSILPALEVLVCETLSVCALVEFLECRINGLTCPSIRHADIRGSEESLSIDDITREDDMFIKIQLFLEGAGRNISIVIHDSPMSYALGKRGEEGNGLFEFLGS